MAYRNPQQPPQQHPPPQQQDDLAIKVKRSFTNFDTNLKVRDKSEFEKIYQPYT
jgi:hypothetical protein